MFNKLKQSASSVASSASEVVGSVSANVKDTARVKTEEALQEAIQFIKSNAENIKSEIIDRVGEYTDNWLLNDATKGIIAAIIYSLLPVPVQWVVSEDEFKEFFLKNSESIFNALGFA